MTKLAKSFFKNESGATAIEYGLIAALIVIVTILAMKAIGQELKGSLETVAENIKTTK